MIKKLPKYVLSVEDYPKAEGFKVYTLDVKSEDFTNNVKLLSSKEGKELNADIRYLRNSVKNFQ